MKTFKHRLNKGFTLIELMVVISIISLLSSIVLASVKEVRERAGVTAFKASINQFINALELYKVDNGVYPGQAKSGPVYFNLLISRQNSLGGTIVQYAYAEENGIVTIQTYNDFVTILKPYIKDFPKPPTVSKYIGDTYFTYTSQFTNELNRKCFNDVNTPPYVILVPSFVPGFESWSLGASVLPTIPDPLVRCFSLK